MLPTPSPVLGPDWAERVRRERPRRALLVAGTALLVGIAASLGIVANRFGQTDVSAQSASPRTIIIGGPEEAKVGEFVTKPITITVRANNVPDATYAGTIHFSVKEDATAIVPGDYTFTATDAGVHEFSQAVKFSKAGTMTLVAEDTTDPTLTNEITITATDSGGVGLGDTKPVITEPANGSTVNTPSVTIRGTAGPNATVSIMDNGVPIGTTPAATDGSFSFTASTLAPNMAHLITAVAGSTSSDPVSITVQTTATLAAPDLIISPETITVDPAQPLPKIDAQVLADRGLSRVQLQITSVPLSVDLIEAAEQPGTYRGTFTAPNAPGSYPIDVLVTSALGQAQPYAGLKTLTVVLASALPTDIPRTNEPPVASFSFEPTSGAIPLTVTFTSDAIDAEDGTALTYFWDFGDGSTSTDMAPTHIYRTNGPYTPMLTVTDKEGASATAQASTEITATGPAMLLALLAVSAGVAAVLARRRRTI